MKDLGNFFEVDNIVRSYTGDRKISTRRLTLPKKGALVLEPEADQPEEYVTIFYIYNEGLNYEVLGSYEEIRELVTGQPTVPDVAQSPVEYPGVGEEQTSHPIVNHPHPQFRSLGQLPSPSSQAQALPETDPEHRD